MTEATIQIEGMSCQHCVMRVRRALEGLTGIGDLNVTVGQVTVSFDEAKISKKDIEDTINKAGYKVRS
ncbi:MAG: heavy-metal-associated domain-containing protein [Nitrospirae bacterium]|nr:heavy-metal-associated domain-containing protein [Nitrospirota bacterium]